MEGLLANVLLTPAKCFLSTFPSGRALCAIQAMRCDVEYWGIQMRL